MKKLLTSMAAAAAIFSSGGCGNVYQAVETQQQSYQQSALEDILQSVVCLRNTTTYVNPEGEKIAVVRDSSSFERKKIEQLRDGDGSAEIVGTVVQVFDPSFFNVCSECNRKVTESMGAFSCATHGEVKPSLSYVMNLIVDDGTGNIRSVLWKNQTTHLLEKTEEQMAVYKENMSAF